MSNARVRGRHFHLVCNDAAVPECVRPLTPHASLRYRDWLCGAGFHGPGGPGGGALGGLGPLGLAVGLHLAPNGDVGAAGAEVRPHLHAHVSFRSARDHRRVCALLPGVHVELARQPGASWAYALKEGGVCGGSPPAGGNGRVQGAGAAGRPAAAAAVRAARDAECIRQVWGAPSLRGLSEDAPSLVLSRYRTVLGLRGFAPPPCRREVRVLVLWGDPGVGKTWRAFNDIWSDVPHYRLPPPPPRGVPWFDGYDSEDKLIVDDFDGNQLTFRYLLQILDHYELRLQVKGAFTWAAWTKVVITSNTRPEDWYPEEEFAPLARRLHSIVHCTDREQMIGAPCAGRRSGAQPKAYSITGFLAVPVPPAQGLPV